MSRGLGKFQRSILDSLAEPRSEDEIRTTLFGAEPSGSQRRNLRRALGRLIEDDHVHTTAGEREVTRRRFITRCIAEPCEGPGCRLCAAGSPMDADPQDWAKRHNGHRPDEALRLARRWGVHRWVARDAGKVLRFAEEGTHTAQVTVYCAGPDPKAKPRPKSPKAGRPYTEEDVVEGRRLVAASQGERPARRTQV